MKIGLIGYQGSGKSTLFEWLTGVAPDPSKSHTGQCHGPSARAARYGPVRRLQSEKNHVRRAGNRRYAGPEPLARGEPRGWVFCAIAAAW